MILGLLHVILPAGAIGAAYVYRKQILKFLVIVRYELLYWAIGGLAVGDDMVWGWKNKFKGKFI